MLLSSQLYGSHKEDHVLANLGKTGDPIQRNNYSRRTGDMAQVIRVPA
jgi:hypothetical protein